MKTIKQKLIASIESAPEPILEKTLEYIECLKNKTNPSTINTGLVHAELSQVKNEDIIEIRVKKVISEQLGFEVENVSLNHALFLVAPFSFDLFSSPFFSCSGSSSKDETNLPNNDFQMDGLDAVELLMALKEEFELEISDEEAEKIRTVQELVNFIKSKRGYRK